MLKRLVARINTSDRGASLVEYGLLVCAILLGSAVAAPDALRTLLP